MTSVIAAKHTLHSRRPIVAFAVLLGLVVFGARLPSDDSHEPIMFLLVVPVGLIAAEVGVRCLPPRPSSYSSRYAQAGEVRSLSGTVGIPRNARM